MKYVVMPKSQYNTASPNDLLPTSTHPTLHPYLPPAPTSSTADSSIVPQTNHASSRPFHNRL